VDQLKWLEWSELDWTVCIGDPLNFWHQFGQQKVLMAFEPELEFRLLAFGSEFIMVLT